ncbi:Coenzyme F420 hydrogenase/dehydrogenase, beta subunit C-terminal domain [Parabacteroides faecis]|uniref:Coenzyme F420 hydrogenase/dehydrogenase, beta subunit C-terminal domain n=1 Tax=Parabacteroides faecis TaxID=1217282 RepID=UPI00351F85D3
MINITDKNQCCGCTACASVCGHNSITMVEDAEGFKFPKVDVATCVNCGLCEKVCPMLHPESERSVRRVIGAKHQDVVVRKACSSGGVFSLLAEVFIVEGGVVVGCAMDKNLHAVHIICETLEDIIRLRSSKYVQSNVEGIFPQVRKQLLDGRKVLFSGTPCQVAGLRKFLIKPFDNLYCVDVLCHGVPSPKLFKEYKEMMEQLYGSHALFISFRSKRKEWKRLYINLHFDNGKEYFKNATFDPYMQLFLSNKSQRNACFHCPFTTTNRQGDLSLGDFWGIGRDFPDLDDDKGISMILINSDKGKEMYSKIMHQIISFESNLDQAIYGNKVLVENILGEMQRNRYYATYVTEGLQVSFNKHTQHYSFWREYYIRLMRWGLDFIRYMRHTSY